MTDISIQGCPTYDFDVVFHALSRALTPIGGLDWVTSGMRIAIKVNMVSAMKPESAAPTHPTVVCALVKLLTDRGATVIVGDSPGGVYTSAYVNHVYKVTGMTAVTAYGAALNDDFGTRTVVYDEAHAAKSFSYTSYLDDVDAVINCCKLKTHGMMGMSAAVKNMFGVIPGTCKPEYHYRYASTDVFAHMLIDLNEYVKPRLVIVDAIVGMEGNGPTAGTPRSIGALIASKSPYLADEVCAKLIGMTRQEIPTLAAAVERGLAPADFESIAIAGAYQSFIQPNFQVDRVRRDMDFRSHSTSFVRLILSQAMSLAMRAKPDCQKNLCIGCEKCAQVCPAKAITMKDKKPSIQRRACIRCFCCQEFCPVAAMRVKRPLLARLRRS